MANTNQKPDRQAPLLAPGAERAGTTDRGPWAPAQGRNLDALNDLSADPEAPTASGNVALNPGVEGVPGPNPDVGAAPELADPNYTAASPRRRVDTPDAGVTRMGTGPAGNFAQAQSPNRRPARRVADVMTADVAVCGADSEIYYVARMMDARDVGAIPVVESTDTMKPVGVVTDRDIAIRVVARNQDAKGLRARDVMSANVLAVTPDTCLDDCRRRMEERQVRRVVVVDGNGRVCGIVAQADLARFTPNEKAGELVKEVSQPDKAGAQGQYH